jgi:hypothetical protein
MRKEHVFANYATASPAMSCRQHRLSHIGKQMRGACCGTCVLWIVRKLSFDCRLLAMVGATAARLLSGNAALPSGSAAAIGAAMLGDRTALCLHRTSTTG